MSHLNTAFINAQIIRLEEQFKAAMTRLEKYQMRDEIKQKLMESLNINDVKTQIEHIKNTMNINGLNQVTNRINQFFDGIENYVMLSFDLDKKDYNEAIQNMFEMWSENNKGVLSEALSETNDELLQNYMITAYRNDPYVSKDMLKSQAENMMKDSLQFQKKRAQNNLEKILISKGIDKVISKSENENPTKTLTEINNENTQKTVDKAVRNRVLNSVLKIIKQQGFLISKENVVEKGDHAIINSIKPNGEAVRFEVYLDGRFVYKFHDYEGLSCEKDIENFEKQFESIYGFKIEDKKTTWSNPDKLKKQNHNTFNNNKIGG